LILLIGRCYQLLLIDQVQSSCPRRACLKSEFAFGANETRSIKDGLRSEIEQRRARFDDRAQALFIEARF
jgi:hypothetical protein